MVKTKNLMKTVMGIYLLLGLAIGWVNGTMIEEMENDENAK